MSQIRVLHIGVFSATGTKWRLADQVERFCEVKLERTVCPRAYLCRSCLRKISNLVEKCKQLVVNSQAIRKITVGSKRVRGVAFAQSPGTGATPHGKVRRHRPAKEKVSQCVEEHHRSSVGLSPPDRSDSSLSPQPRSTHSTSSELPRRRLFDCESSHESGILTAGVQLPQNERQTPCGQTGEEEVFTRLSERTPVVSGKACFFLHARTQAHASPPITISHSRTRKHTHTRAHAHTRTHTHTHTHTHTRTHTHASLLNFSNTYTKCTNTLCMFIFSQEFLCRNHRLATVIS